MPAIGSVRLTPANPRPGQTVVVEVLDEQGSPLPASSVIVNGRPGAVHHLQFGSEGTRKLAVRTIGSGGSESREVAVPVTGEPVTFKDPHTATAQTAMMHVRQSQHSAYVATFSLGSPVDTSKPAPKPQPGPVIPLPYPAPHPGPHPVPHPGPIPAPHPGPFPKPLPHPLPHGRGVLGEVIGKHGSSPVSRVTPVVRERKGIARRMTSTVVKLDDVDIAKIIAAEHKSAKQHQFEWDFGDGTKATTPVPMVSHDYFAALGPDDDHGVFTVTCTSRPDNVTVSRTLVVYSAYAMCKKQGAIVPHLEADVYATKGPLGFSGTFTVHNIEDFPLVLDHMAIVALADAAKQGDDLGVPAFTALKTPITVAAKSSSVISVNAAYSATLPDNAPGFTVYYGGSAKNTKVRLSHTFEISAADQHKKPPTLRLPGPGHNVPVHTWPWQEVEKGIGQAFRGIDVLQRSSTAVDTATGTISVSLGRNSAVAKSDKMRTAVRAVLGAATAPLYAKHIEGLATPRIFSRPFPDQLPRPLPQPHPGPLPPTPHPSPQPAPPPQVGSVAEGQICDPDNISDAELAQADAENLVCQLTTEEMQVMMPGRFVNARKGDVILSPGGAGIIAELLRQVNPPQKHSHSGIMTRNYDEITHSTGSEEWLQDHMVGVLADGSDGFDPNSLKYLWPGVVRQSIDAAVNGEPFVAPEGGKYSISSFSPHAIGATFNDNFEIVPPLVVKPDPFEETDTVRAALHAAAVEAASGAGRPNVRSKSHYRFYGYTDPVSILATVGAEAGWANGTYGTVCSSFVWSVHRKLGHHMEATTTDVMPTDLEPADIAQGAEVGPNNPDGLYRYSAAERKVAAQWLYDYIYNAAEDKAGWLGGLLTDAPDDTANQFVNTFANDDADGKDSDAWQQLKDAIAISPDNILFWDPPSKGGLYGFAEPLQYREPRVETYTVSRWKKVVTKGKVHGRVTYNGQGVGGATVVAYDGKATTTAADGSYTLTDVPLGSYELKAQQVIGSLLCQGTAKINLTSADLAVDIVLQAPDESNRIAQLYVDFYGVDDETFGDNEIDDPGPEYFEVAVNPNMPVNTLTLPDYHWGGELRVSYKFTCRLLANNDIDVEVQCWLYEGTDESTTDLDGTSSMSFTVPRDQTVGNTLRTDNTDEGGDWCQLAVTVKNTRNTN